MVSRTTTFSMKLFISYAREDEELALTLEQGLSKYHSCWIDSKSLRAGTKWEMEIEKAIKECEVFLFITTPHSLRSSYCQQEVGLAAQKYKKVIIPLMGENLPTLPEELAKLQWIFLKDIDSDLGLLLGELSRLQPFPWVDIAIVEAAIILLLVGIILGIELP